MKIITNFALCNFYFMTLQQLEYIVAVDKHHHFARAAEECGVTQPTLSAMLAKLEAELGVKLFVRSSQQVVTTDVGSQIVLQASKVLASAHRIPEIAAENLGSLSGTFRIGILPTIAPYLLPLFFPQLLRDHPEMGIRVVEMRTAEIRRALEVGEIDAAIVVRLQELKTYRLTTLYYEQFLAYVSQNDPLFKRDSIRSTDLRDEFVWLLDEGHCFRDQLVKFCQIRSARSSKAAYSLGSIETFMRMVEMGRGITFIPELAVSQLTNDQRKLVRPFAIPIPTREVVMMTTDSFVRKSVLEHVCNAIRSAVPQQLLQFNNTKHRLL